MQSDNTSSSRLGIWNHIPGFLYPKGDSRYANLPIVSDLVKALEKRDFRVPSVTIKFDLAGDGMDKFKSVEKIQYDPLDIDIWFCYGQGSLPGYESHRIDIGGLATCHIQGRSCHFDSGYQDWVYTGSNWKRDKEAFRDWQFSSCIDKFTDRLANPILSKENKLIFVHEIEKLIRYVESFPVVETREFKNSLATTEDEFSRYIFEPYPEHYPTLYVFQGSWSSSNDGVLEICRRFQVPFDDLDKRKRIVNFSRPRLVHWRSIANNIPSQKKVPYLDMAKDGFIWAKIQPNDFSDWTPKNSTYIILKIRPHYLDDIYVADLTAAQEYRTKCFETTDRLSNAQYDWYIALRGVNVVTLKDYMEKGMVFQHLQYLIRKPIGYDEVESIHRLKSKREANDAEKVQVLKRK